MTRPPRRSSSRRAARGFWIRAWGQREPAPQRTGRLDRSALWLGWPKGGLDIPASGAECRSLQRELPLRSLTRRAGSRAGRIGTASIASHRSLLYDDAVPVVPQPIEQDPVHSAVPLGDGRPFCSSPHSALDAKGRAYRRLTTPSNDRWAARVDEPMAQLHGCAMPIGKFFGSAYRLDARAQGVVRVHVWGQTVTSVDPTEARKATVRRFGRVRRDARLIIPSSGRRTIEQLCPGPSGLPVTDEAKANSACRRSGGARRQRKTRSARPARHGQSSTA